MEFQCFNARRSRNTPQPHFTKGTRLGTYTLWLDAFGVRAGEIPGFAENSAPLATRILRIERHVAALLLQQTSIKGRPFKLEIGMEVTVPGGILLGAVGVLVPSGLARRPRADVVGRNRCEFSSGKNAMGRV